MAAIIQTSIRRAGIQAPHIRAAVNERSLEITEKSKGEVTGTRQIELSPDLKTLTVTMRLVGQSQPQSILVFERD